MKRVFVFLITLFLLFHGTEAQKINFGIKGGTDIVNNRFKPNSSNWGVTNRLSYDYGLLISYSPAKIFQIQLESGFIEKGGQLKFKYVDEKWIFKYGYLSNQLVFILKPIRRLNVEIGSELSRTLYAKQIRIPGQTIDDRLSDYKKYEFSGLAGLGFNFFDNAYIYLRYVYAFTPLIETWVLADPGPNYSYKIYNHYISLGLRYYFLRKDRYL